MASCWDPAISAAFCFSTSLLVTPGGKTRSSSMTALGGSSQPRRTSQPSTAAPGPPRTRTVVKSSSPLVGYVGPR